MRDLLGIIPPRENYARDRWATPSVRNKTSSETRKHQYLCLVPSKSNTCLVTSSFSGRLSKRAGNGVEGRTFIPKRIPGQRGHVVNETFRCLQSEKGPIKITDAPLYLAIALGFCTSVQCTNHLISSSSNSIL